MDDTTSNDLIFQLARYTVKRAIGRLNLTSGDRQHYCDCCKAKVGYDAYTIEDLKHKPDCLYLQAKAILLLAPPEEDKP